MKKYSLLKSANLWLFIACIVLFVVAVGVSYERYVVFKDFPMFLQAPCDPAIESCFVRDCSTGECPPNNLEIYKNIEVSASFFKTCKDNTCANECSIYPDKCVVEYCSDESEDGCVTSLNDTIDGTNI